MKPLLSSPVALIGLMASAWLSIHILNMYGRTFMWLMRTRFDTIWLLRRVWFAWGITRCRKRDSRACMWHVRGDVEPEVSSFIYRVCHLVWRVLWRYDRLDAKKMGGWIWSSWCKENGRVDMIVLMQRKWAGGHWSTVLPNFIFSPRVKIINICSVQNLNMKKYSALTYAKLKIRILRGMKPRKKSFARNAIQASRKLRVFLFTID